MCDFFHALYLQCALLCVLFYSALSLFSLYWQGAEASSVWQMCLAHSNSLRSAEACLTGSGKLGSAYTDGSVYPVHPVVALPPFSVCRKWPRQPRCRKHMAAIPFVADQSFLNVNRFIKNHNIDCPVNWAGSFHLCSQNNWCVHRTGFSS